MKMRMGCVGKMFLWTLPSLESAGRELHYNSQPTMVKQELLLVTRPAPNKAISLFLLAWSTKLDATSASITTLIAVLVLGGLSVTPTHEERAYAAVGASGASGANGGQVLPYRIAEFTRAAQFPVIT